MPLLMADPVSVLPVRRDLLEQLVRTHSTPQQLAPYRPLTNAVAEVEPYGVLHCPR